MFWFVIVHILSGLIRGCLPNPYVNLFGKNVYADLFNIVIGGYILHKLSFWLTGIGYTKGVDNPVSGSIGYLFSYILLTFIITGVGKIFNNIVIIIVVFLVIYFILCILVNKIFNRNHRF